MTEDKVNISPIDIKQKQFALKFRGFDVKEVDGFLNEVTDEMESLIRENETLKEAKATLEGQLMEYKETEKNLRDTLMAAQRMADDMKSSSLRESDLKIKEAELEADRILRTARHELSKTEEEIEELRRIKERFKLKIKGVVEDHLKMIMYEDKQEGVE